MERETQRHADTRQLARQPRPDRSACSSFRKLTDAKKHLNAAGGGVARPHDPSGKQEKSVTQVQKVHSLTGRITPAVVYDAWRAVRRPQKVSERVFDQASAQLGPARMVIGMAARMRAGAADRKG